MNNYVYLAIIWTTNDGNTDESVLGVYGSFSEAKSAVIKYLARQYIFGMLHNVVTLKVTKYDVDGEFLDEWCGKDLYCKEYNSERWWLKWSRLNFLRWFVWLTARRGWHYRQYSNIVGATSRNVEWLSRWPKTSTLYSRLYRGFSATAMIISVSQKFCSS